MNTGYLYFLLPVIFFPIASIINVQFGRKIGALKMSLYRQLTITIVGSPIIISLIGKSELLEKHWLTLIACGIFGASYLAIAFHSMTLTSIGISRTFAAISRTISSFLIGYILFQEQISQYDILGILVIFSGFFLLSRFSGERLSENDIIGIIVSLIAGVIFSINSLLFKTYAIDFSGLEAAYLLEITSLIPLFIFTLISRKKTIYESLFIEKKKLGILCLTAPLVILASYGAAKSINIIPFHIFNTLFVGVLIVSIILSWIFLKEKFTLKQLFAMGIMIFGCGVVILF